MYPDYAVGYCGRASVYYKIGDYNKALEDYKKANLLDPKVTIPSFPSTSTNTTETKNTPGFELPSLICGSLLVAYILNKRKR